MPLLKPYIAAKMADKPDAPVMSPEEERSIKRREKVETQMTSMFGKLAETPLDEQRYYDERRNQIYTEGRERQQQQLMGAMNRTGALGSGATNYNLMRFGQETLRDQQQFYFEDRQRRTQERQSIIQTGTNILGSPVVGTQQTDLMNARIQQRNEWKNRYANIVANAGML